MSWGKWRQITCAERDALVCSVLMTGWEVSAMITDAHGEYGTPKIMTRWEKNGVQVEDTRWPDQGSYNPKDDVEPCEHRTRTKENTNA